MLAGEGTVIRFAVEMNEWIWKQVVKGLRDVTAEEAEWRPLPQANNINLIIRHLRIEAQWQLAAIQHAVPMPAEITENDRALIDSVPLDNFEQNFKELQQSCVAFIAALRRLTITELEQRGDPAYREYRKAGVFPERYFLGYHHAMHLSQHLGQIHTIRNLYLKTRGEPARFFPENPTFPG